MKSIMFNVIALTLLLPLAACDQAEHTDAQPASAATTAQVAPAASSQAPTSWVARRVADAMHEARQELATKNIDVDTVHVGSSRRSGGTRSKAQITPQGELLIDGKPVAATPEQRGMLLGYRQRIIAIAEAGMDIGTQGADLGIRAAKEAMWGAFTGKSDHDIEASIKPQTEQIKAAAATLCRRLPDLLLSQQKLAAAMPEFRPYATMRQQDVDDCGKDMRDKNGKQGFAVFSD